jgi:hypothetical protein
MLDNSLLLSWVDGNSSIDPDGGLLKINRKRKVTSRTGTKA